MLSPTTIPDVERLLSDIIAKRKELVGPIRLTRDRLQKLMRSLHPILESLNNAASSASSSTQVHLKSYADKLRRLDPQCETISKQLRQLEARLAQDTIRLLVIGLARQGKSSFLQKATGLTATEIPSGNGGDCTHALCIVNHFEGTPYAEIDFHSPDTFLKEVVQPFFRALYRREAPATMSEFLAMTLPTLDGTDQVEKALQDELLKIRSHYPDFKDYLTGEQSKRIQLNDVCTFVAKTHKDGNQTGWRYLATAEARVFCSFGSHGLKQLSVIDCKGFSGVEPNPNGRLARIVSEEADTLLLVRMPNLQGDEVNIFDRSLIKSIGNSLSPRRVEDVLHVLLNRYDRTENNYQRCLAMRDSLIGDVAKVYIADCTSDEVIDSVIEPVLQHLATEQGRLDQKSLQPIQHAVMAFISDVANLLKEAKVLAENYQEQHNEFEKGHRSKEALAKLRTALARAKPDVTSYRNGIKTKVDEQVAKLIEQMEFDSDIPTVEAFRSTSDTGGIPYAFFYFKGVIRNRWLQVRQKVDKKFENLFEDFRDEVRRVFQDDGLLGKLELEDSNHWWSALAERITSSASDERNCLEVASMLRRFGSQTFSISTAIDEIVNDCTQALNKNDVGFIPIDLTIAKPRDIVRRVVQSNRWGNELVCNKRLLTEEQAIAVLASAHQATLQRFRSHVCDLSDRICNQLMSSINVFIDNVTTNVNDLVWDSLYRNYAQQLWPEVYAQQAKLNQNLVALIVRVDMVVPELVPEQYTFHLPRLGHALGSADARSEK